jgi:hypothetical protein
MRNGWLCRIAAWAGILSGAFMHCGAASAHLNASVDRMLHEAAREAGVPFDTLAPDLQDYAHSATRERRPKLLRAWLKVPSQIPRQALDIEQKFRAAAGSPSSVLARTVELGGMLAGSGPGTGSAQAVEQRLRCASDPLATGMAMLQRETRHASTVSADASDVRESWGLRLQIGQVLAAIGHAEKLRGAALRDIAQHITPSALAHRATALEPLPITGDTSDAADYRPLLPLLDRARLHAGMQQLVAAVQTLDRFLAANVGRLPTVAWRWDTPMGEVVIDTTGRSSVHRLQSPLLVVDVGGDDLHIFEERAAENRISILIDRGGNDRYVATAAASDPSAAIMGYGILWDTSGDDRYEGGVLAQGAALFGEALHFDGGGSDKYTATSFSQAFALGGMAVLMSSDGDDQFSALTHAQGSAGPEGVAVLMDTAGNDRYLLGNEPLVLDSSQLPDRNVSMGQGAGRGERAMSGDGRSLTGGVGMLLDLAGDDHYTAQVFAQGVGYYEGVGLLIDGGGNDRFSAAWYAMGAAAHQAVGVLVNRGQGADTYRASHSTSLGAAHDFSVAVFVEEGGDDAYALGNLGLGAAHDNSVAIFLDLGGVDRYVVDNPRCQAFGISLLTDLADWRRKAPGRGLFLESSAHGSHESSRRARINASCPKV